MVARKRITLTVIVGLFVELLNKVSPLLILHYAQKHLGVERFGYAQFGLTLVDFSLPFIAFGYSTIGAIEIGKYRDRPDKVGKIIGTIYGLKSIHGLIAGIGLLLIVFLVPGYQQFFPIVIALSFLPLLTVFELNFVHVATQKMMLMGFFMGSAKIISLVLIVLLVKAPEDAVIYAMLTMGANALVNILTIVYGLKKFRPQWPDVASMKDLFRRSLPFAGVLLFIMVHEKYDMFIANGLFGTYGAGLYAAPARIAQSVYSAMMALSMVFFSEMVAIKDKTSFSEHLRLGFWTIFMFMAPLVFGIWFVDRNVLTFIMGDEYQGVAKVLSLLVVSVAAHAAIAIFGSQILALRDRAHEMVICLALGAALGMTASWNTASAHGMMGIAVGVLLGKSVAAALIIYRSRPFIDHMPVKELLNTVIPGALMAVALWLLNSQSFFLNAGAGGAVFAVFALWLNRQSLKTALSTYRSRHH